MQQVNAKDLIIEYKNTENLNYPTIQQCFYLYTDKDYFLTDVFLLSSGTSNIESNYIAPIYTETQNRFLPQDANNRFLSFLSITTVSLLTGRFRYPEE